MTGQEAAATVASAGMRRLLAWLAGVLGGLAAYRAATRRRALPAAPVAGPDPRADELRARLAETRPTGEVADEAAAGEMPAAGAADADERRRAVHEEARAALDEMRPRDGS